VTPDENLAASANISVSGSGLGSNSPVAIDQCTSDLTNCQPIGSTATNNSGTFGPTAVTVTQIFTGDGGFANCGTKGCVVRIVQGLGEIPVPITFAAPPPPPPPPPPDTDAPETSITKRPPNRLDQSKAKFKFTADEPGASFECKIDRKPFKACTSPKVVKRLDDGKHKFKVRAIDAAGNVDSTLAKDRFRVVDSARRTH
jgi:hypothetical protein